MLEVLGALGMLIAMVCTFSGIHMVDEGHVAVYYRGGALLDGINDPGWHVKFPVITTYE